MLGRLFLLFTIVPLVELYLLIWLAGLIGFWPTLAIVMTTALVGATLAKREGLKVVRDWQAALAEMRVPEEGLTGALLVLIAGVFLVTPGVLTDLTGLLLLVPPVRRRLARWIERRYFPNGAASFAGAQTFQHVTVGPAGVRREVRAASFRRVVPVQPTEVSVEDHGPAVPKEPELLEADIVVDRRGRVIHHS